MRSKPDYVEFFFVVVVNVVVVVVLIVVAVHLRLVVVDKIWDLVGNECYINIIRVRPSDSSYISITN